MKKERHLLLARNIFVFFVFIALTLVVVSEKGIELVIPKVQKEMESYLTEKYPELNNIKKSTVTYQSNKYQMKITSKNNKNLYFYINRKNKKITDTYQKDYVEGNSLFSYLTKKLQNEIKQKTSTNIKVNILSTLDKYTTKTKEQILLEDNLLQLKFFIIEKEELVKEWNATAITNQLINSIELFTNNDITPKSYTFNITNEEDITESIEIKNINKDSLTKEIIQDILDDNYSKRLRDNKIKYNYLYKED